MRRRMIKSITWRISLRLSYHGFVLCSKLTTTLKIITSITKQTWLTKFISLPKVKQVMSYLFERTLFSSKLKQEMTLVKSASSLPVLKWKMASKKFSRTNRENFNDALQFKLSPTVRHLVCPSLTLLECVKNSTTISTVCSTTQKYDSEDYYNKS
jgi:hypothetical protein